MQRPLRARSRAEGMRGSARRAGYAGAPGAACRSFSRSRHCPLGQYRHAVHRQKLVHDQLTAQLRCRAMDAIHRPWRTPCDVNSGMPSSPVPCSSSWLSTGGTRRGRSNTAPSTTMERATAKSPRWQSASNRSPVSAAAACPIQQRKPGRVLRSAFFRASFRASNRPIRTGCRHLHARRLCRAG